MATEPQHPYIRDGYKGTKGTRETFAKITAKQPKSLPLLSDSDFNYFCILRQSAYRMFTEKKADEMLQDSMARFIKTGDFRLIVKIQN